METKEHEKKTLKDAEFLVGRVERFDSGKRKDVEITLLGNGWFPWDTIEELAGKNVRLVVKKEKGK